MITNFAAVVDVVTVVELVVEADVKMPIMLTMLLLRMTMITTIKAM
jgi:hypothetical protein